jgi:hypothetical protein
MNLRPNRAMDAWMRGADEVAEGLGAVGVIAPGDVAVEFVQKLGVDRYSNPAEPAHAYT